MGISEGTFYNWKRKYGGLGVSELRSLKQLEEENRRLKNTVADLSLYKEMLQEVLRQKVIKPAGRRQLADFLKTAYKISERNAVKTVYLQRSTYRYHPHPRDYCAERLRIRELAEGLNLRRKRPRRRVAAAHRMERPQLFTINQSWSMDFLSDQLFNGRRIRELTAVDNFSRECLAIVADFRLRGTDVLETMEHLRLVREVPERIQVDNGSEFISKALDKWAYENEVVLDFSRPGKPTDNPYIESFNGNLRDEVLNREIFDTLFESRVIIGRWR